MQGPDKNPDPNVWSDLLTKKICFCRFCFTEIVHIFWPRRLFMQVLFHWDCTHLLTKKIVYAGFVSLRLYTSSDQEDCFCRFCFTEIVHIFWPRRLFLQVLFHWGCTHLLTKKIVSAGFVSLRLYTSSDQEDCFCRFCFTEVVHIFWPRRLFSAGFVFTEVVHIFWPRRLFLQVLFHWDCTHLSLTSCKILVHIYEVLPKIQPDLFTIATNQSSCGC